MIFLKQNCSVVEILKDKKLLFLLFLGNDSGKKFNITLKNKRGKTIIDIIKKNKWNDVLEALKKLEYDIPSTPVRYVNKIYHFPFPGPYPVRQNDVFTTMF